MRRNFNQYIYKFIVAIFGNTIFSVSTFSIQAATLSPTLQSDINGISLSDNVQIPNTLRGYVQLAIDKGLFEAFPAEVRQLPNGTFIALPGSCFEPNTNTTRSNLASRLKSYNQLFTTGG